MGKEREREGGEEGEEGEEDQGVGCQRSRPRDKFLPIGTPTSWVHAYQGRPYMIKGEV